MGLKDDTPRRARNMAERNPHCGGSFGSGTWFYSTFPRSWASAGWPGRAYRPRIADALAAGVARVSAASALVVSALSARFPQEGGLYIWTKHAFGDWHGFLCAWLYFISNVCSFRRCCSRASAWRATCSAERGVGYSEDRALRDPRHAGALCGSAFLANLVGLRVGKWPALLGRFHDLCDRAAAVRLRRSGRLAIRIGHAFPFRAGAEPGAI